MSGPKKSKWEIRQERIEELRRQRAIKRQKQIDEIRNRINIVLNNLANIANIKTSQNIKNWIQNIDLTGDLRVAFREIKGIENYLQKVLKIQKEHQKFVDLAKEFENEKLQEEKELQKLKSKTIIEDLELIKEDFKDILNDAIIQKIEIFKNSISINPENQNTINQIKNFKNQLFKIQQKYQENIENINYIADTFSNILNSKIQKNGDEIEIVGDIDGVPIKVRLHKQNNNINFDTPIDGSCEIAMKKIQEELSKSNINLGAIKVVKTGKILNQNSNIFNKERIRQ